MRDEPKDEVTPQEVDPTLEGAETSPNLETNETFEEPDAQPEQVVEPANNEPVLEDSSALPKPTDSASILSTPTEPVAQTEPLTPEAAPVIAPAQPVLETTPVLPKKSKKALIIGLISAGVAALLIGGSVLAYNFWYQNPDKVVSDAIVNAITAKTVSATGKLEVETDDYKLKIEVAAKNSMEADSQVAVKLTYSADDFVVSVDGEGVYSADGDIYIKLNDAKKLVASIEEQSNGQINFEVFGTIIDKIDGKWVKIGKEDLGEFSEEYEKAQKCIADISKQLDEDASFRRSVEKEVGDLYQEHQFVIVGEKLGSRTINGQGSLGYKLDVDPEIADAFFTGLADTELGSRLQGCNEDIKFADIVSDDTKKGDGEESGAEIWVSRFGHYITEVNAKPTPEDDVKGSLVINPVFNKEESIEIPTESIPLSELMTDIEKAYEEYYASYYDSYDYSMYDTEATTTEFN